VYANAQRIAARSRQTERLRRASFFYRSSSKYRGSASAEPSTFRAFSFPPFRTLSKTNTRSCTSGTAARCHLKLPRQREPQMTTQDPLPRGALPTTSNGHCWCRVLPVRSFVVRCVPGAIRALKRPCHCLAASSPTLLFRGVRLLLKRLSQSPAFESPSYQPGTAEPPAAAVDLPGLVMTLLRWSRR